MENGMWKCHRSHSKVGEGWLAEDVTKAQKREWEESDKTPHLRHHTGSKLKYPQNFKF